MTAKDGYWLPESVEGEWDPLIYLFSHKSSLATLLSLDWGLNDVFVSSTPSSISDGNLYLLHVNEMPWGTEFSPQAARQPLGSERQTSTSSLINTQLLPTERGKLGNSYLKRIGLEEVGQARIPGSTSAN